MEHFYDRIPGWFYFDKYYVEAVQAAPQTAHFVEVGSFKGRSTAFLAVEIINSGKQIRFDCVDTWMGSEEHQAGGSHPDASVINGTLFEEFIQNMQPAAGHYIPIRLPSVGAAYLYPDNSLDFVFLDAAHDYLNVRADILAWLPKVKPGSVLAGDDYGWPGVKQAVDELLPGAETGQFWRYTKPAS